MSPLTGRSSQTKKCKWKEEEEEEKEEEEEEEKEEEEEEAEEERLTMQCRGGRVAVLVLPAVATKPLRPPLPKPRCHFLSSFHHSDQGDPAPLSPPVLDPHSQSHPPSPPSPPPSLLLGGI